jgi:hypothetical protein
VDANIVADEVSYLPDPVRGGGGGRRIEPLRHEEE